MSKAATDDNSAVMQAFRLPRTGFSVPIATLIGVGVSSAVLPAGMYRIISDADVTLASDTVPATPAATANDLPMRANTPEYFYVNAGDTISAFDAVGGNAVILTRMP